jgi:four helix bundle protein
MDFRITVDKNYLMIYDVKQEYEIDLRKRLFKFAAESIRILKYIPDGREFDVFRFQLSKSATSIGANYEESQAASYAEFRQKIQICLRESRETHYWLRLIKEVVENSDAKFQEILNFLISEIDVIQKIFGAISSKIRKNTSL